MTGMCSVTLWRRLEREIEEGLRQAEERLREIEAARPALGDEVADDMIRSVQRGVESEKRHKERCRELCAILGELELLNLRLSGKAPKPN